MLSSRFRHKFSNMLNNFAKYFLWADPNWITLFSLVIATFAAYAGIYGDFLLYGILVLLTGLMDTLDGAVARLKNAETELGNYLDAICDRISEIILLLPFINYHPILAYAAISGSLSFSYAKARFAMIKSTNNNEWPQFGERAERLLLLSIGMITVSFFVDLLQTFLILLNIVIWSSFLQRIMFASKFLN